MNVLDLTKYYFNTYKLYFILGIAAVIASFMFYQYLYIVHLKSTIITLDANLTVCNKKLELQNAAILNNKPETNATVITSAVATNHIIYRDKIKLVEKWRDSNSSTFSSTNDDNATDNNQTHILTTTEWKECQDAKEAIQYLNNFSF
jgi:hypothetical protein